MVKSSAEMAAAKSLSTLLFFVQVISGGGIGKEMI